MDNRENILDCALELFASKGYNAVGIQEIVNAAGITKPTLYHYFGSKQGLLEEILQANFDLFFCEMDKVLTYNHDLPLTLMETAKAMFHFAGNHSLFYRFQLSLSFSAPDSTEQQVITPYNMKFYHKVEELFLKASEDHGNMKGRHKSYAVTYIGMLNTYILVAFKGGVELDDQLVYRATHQFMHGIYS